MLALEEDFTGSSDDVELQDLSKGADEAPRGPINDSNSLLEAISASSGHSTHLDHFETDIPRRLDNLPWMAWHWRVVLALGITWLLDGLEVTLVGVVGTQLTRNGALALSDFQVGLAGSLYLVGAVIGSLFFGYLAEHYGRKRLYMVTPIVYLTATAATAMSFDFVSFCICRIITGAGIGGEYSSINSAIDELIPARVRGFVDLAINGSYWIGAAIGSIASVLFLDPDLLPINVGWRLAFLVGAVIGCGVLLARIGLPESPRWLLIRGRQSEAEEIIAGLEARAVAAGKPLRLEHDHRPLVIHQRPPANVWTVFRVVARMYPRRTILGIVLMTSQAFFYNAVFFTYALVLTQFEGVPRDKVGWYIVPFALGNFLGPLFLGKLFDVCGRRRMIAATYFMSAVLLTITGLLFTLEVLNAITQTVCWSVVFFFSSPAASAAYLTVSEVFPLEVRAICIALFYSLGTGAGGLAGPALFGALISEGSRSSVFIGYVIGAVLMAVAAVVEIVLGVDAEGKSLEDIAAPLSSSKAGEDATSPHEPADAVTPLGN